MLKKLFYWTMLLSITVAMSQTEKGYKVKYLGSNEQSASNAYCIGGTLDNLPITEFNIIMNGTAFPEEEEVYKFTDGNDIYYYFVVDIYNSPFSDRDAFFSSSFSLESNLCNVPRDRGHRVKYIGTTQQQAESNSCPLLLNNIAETRLNINTSTPLTNGGIYLSSTVEGIKYYYIVGSISSYFSDRDFFDISEFSQIIFSQFCDQDGDGVEDEMDNCPFVSNANQLDADSDGFGNVCDNCISFFNPNQIDSDEDGRGDGCDNCPNISNSNQSDSDNDGIGNICDNCPNNFNPDQADSDNDGIGNICDPVDNNARPNLKFSDLDIKVDGVTFNVYNSVPIFKKSKSHEFKFKFGNSDVGVAENVSFRMIVSTNGNNYPFPNGTGQLSQYGPNFHQVGTITGNTVKDYTFIDIFDDAMGSLFLQENRDYVMYIHVDYDGNITESNENDNITSFFFRWDDPTTITSFPTGGGIIEPGIATLKKSKDFLNTSVIIFDLSGREIKNLKIDTNDYMSNSYFETLKSGVYILKFENGVVEKIVID